MPAPSTPATASLPGVPLRDPEAALPFVSVIIPHLNDHDRLERCLRELRRQTYPSHRFEIIVVDNGSRISVEPIVARHPGVVVAAESERGCGTARNRGVGISRGDVLAFTDADCLPDPTWLARGVAMLMRDDAPDIVGGEIEIFAANETAPTDAELYEKVFGFQQAVYVRKKHFAAGANILTTRAAFQRLGPFRNGKVPEDLEWGQRAKAKGLRVAYCEKAVVRHPARRTWTELCWKMDRTVFHNHNFMRERPHFHARWMFLIALLCVPPVDKLWEVAASPRLRGTSEKWRVARTVLRLRYYRIGRMLRCLTDHEALGRGHFSP